MPREIKFRAWNLIEERMYEWHDPLLRPARERSLFEVSEVWTPLQFTGLKDSKGVEVYEGDLIESNNSKATEVFYDEHIGAYQPFAFHGYPVKDWTVIGNIHEHPSLLEGMKKVV